ncbi:extensin family protein [Lacibacterium aquatile]|uniref:Extensin family protein n=1 Tax=Lacibacterium aquatile TaxID=1168082 RepID=A0ABW5DVA7_9PROT
MPPTQEPPKVAGVDRYAVCQANLSEVGWDFAPVASFVTPEGCGVEQAVRLERSSLTLTRPVVVTCDLAYTIARFEFEIIQPLAEEIFGQEVARIDHVGSYNCRGIAGKNSGARLSQHANGRAIDITGFVLKDGTRIRILQDWRGQGRKSDFLQRITKDACKLFSVVLGPNANKDHQDHLHLDVGPQRYCGA